MSVGGSILKLGSDLGLADAGGQETEVQFKRGPAEPGSLPVLRAAANCCQLPSPLCTARGSLAKMS